MACREISPVVTPSPENHRSEKERNHACPAACTLHPGFPASELVDDAGGWFSRRLCRRSGARTRNRSSSTRSRTSDRSTRAGRSARCSSESRSRRSRSTTSSTFTATRSRSRAISRDRGGLEARGRRRDRAGRRCVTALQQMSAGGTKALVVAHSTGGLVLRRLLEGSPSLASWIGHVLALGVPWGGTLSRFACS